MKVLFVSDFDTENPGLRSGVPFFIGKALKEVGINYRVLQVTDKRTLWQRLQSRVKQGLCSAGIWHGFYDAGYSAATAKSYKKCWLKVDFSAFDLVISISPRTVAFLPPVTRLAIWIDNTFDTYAMYPGREGICRQTFAEALQVEKLAFIRATQVYTASSWLAGRLPNTHGLSTEKIRVMPRGSSLQQPPGISGVRQSIAGRIQDGICRLLFVNSGKWLVGRKGGQLVVETFKRLKKDMQVSLVVIGDVPDEVRTSLEEEGVQCPGTINKAGENGEARYIEVLLESHFLFVPSIADGFGIVYAEAASCGLPSIAKAIMGVSEAVQEGITGRLLPAEANAGDFASLIKDQWKDKESYIALCHSAYAYAQEHFRWQKNVASIVEDMNQEIFPK